MAGKTALTAVTVNGAPTTTNGSNAPTSYAVVLESTATYFDVYDSDVVTLFCEVHQAPTGTGPTLDIKLQHAPLTTGPWDDVASGALTQFTTSAAVESVSVSNFGRYVRVVEQFNNADNVYTYSIYLSKVE